jgi:hypothetical protein
VTTPSEHREAEIAAAVADIGEVVPVSESDGWEIADGEHDGMSLAEYVRRFNEAGVSE